MLGPRCLSVTDPARICSLRRPCPGAKSPTTNLFPIYEMGSSKKFAPTVASDPRRGADSLATLNREILMIKQQQYSAARRHSALPALLAGAVFVTVAFLSLTSAAIASSHSDAPLIKLDPQANLTDVYSFITQKENGQKFLVVEVSVRPLEPGDGVMYDSFSPDALYTIHLANPVTGAEVERYDFRFAPVDIVNGSYKNPNTILRYGLGTEVGPIQTVGDARQNFVQKYCVTKVKGNTSTRLNSNSLLVPPSNVGANTTPFYNGPDGRAISGATSRENLDPYTAQTVYDLPNGFTVFAGHAKMDSLPMHQPSSICSTAAFWIMTATRTTASVRMATVWTGSKVTMSCITQS